MILFMHIIIHSSCCFYNSNRSMVPCDIYIPFELCFEDIPVNLFININI
jgi:hypothetical protein